MSKKVLVFLLAISLILVVAVGTVAAITYGEPDGDAHPFVGFMLYKDWNGDYWRCSGTLIAPTVFLTAGHCTFDGVEAWFWFDSQLPLTFPGDFAAHSSAPYAPPDVWASFPNTKDFGVWILDQPVEMAEYGQLAELGWLDQFATERGQQERLVTTVGYGIQSIKPDFIEVPVRFRSSSMIVSLRSNLTDGYNLHTSNNPSDANGAGGACYGDSGGPIFWAETNIVVAVVSFGKNNNCKGANWGYRADINELQDFVAPFLD